MPSPFPGMDPFLEKGPVFHELHTQMLAEAQAQLQRQIRPRYVARLERHLSEGGVWGLDVETLDRKEPDIAVIEGLSSGPAVAPTAVLAIPTVSETEELHPEELALRKQRRIVIYVQARPRVAVTSIELLSPSNKQPGSIGRERYLEKRASALHGGLHWVEIDLLRAGARPPLPVAVPDDADYLAYIARATPTGWDHSLFAWQLNEPLPTLPIPLLGRDEAALNLGACFREAYDRIAADDEAEYDAVPPGPALRDEELAWIDGVLRAGGFRHGGASEGRGGH